MGRIPTSWFLIFVVGFLVALLSASVGFLHHSAIVKSLFGLTTVVGLSLVLLSSLVWVWHERPEGTAEVAAFIGKWGILIAILALLVGHLINAGNH